MLNRQTVSYPYTHRDLQMNAEYDVSNNLIYLGYARPGVADDAAAWQICKYTYDASNNCTAVRFANDVHDYTKVWDDRASYFT